MSYCPSHISNKSQMVWVGEKVTSSRSRSRQTAKNISMSLPVEWSNPRGCDFFTFCYIFIFFRVDLLNPEWLIIEDLCTPKKQTVSFKSYWWVKADLFSWNKPGVGKSWCLRVLLFTNKLSFIGRLLNCHSLFLHTETSYPKSKQHSTKASLCITLSQVLVPSQAYFCC